MNHSVALHPRCASSLWMVACHFFSSAFYFYPYIFISTHTVSTKHNQFHRIIVYMCVITFNGNQVPLHFPYVSLICALQQLRIRLDERLLPEQQSEVHFFGICFSSPCSIPTIAYYVLSIVSNSICNTTFIVRVIIKRCCKVFQDFKDFLHEPFRSVAP